MWNAFAEMLKVFFEKHFIPTVLSLVVGAFCYLLTPEDFWVLAKLSNLGYWILASACFFIMIQFLMWVHKKRQGWKYMRSLNKTSNEHQVRDNEEDVRNLWDYVDSLSVGDRQYLKQFLKNKNRPITIRGDIFYNYASLFSSEHIRKQQCCDEKGPYTKYILEENFYQLLVYSAEIYGKISRFEEV